MSNDQLLKDSPLLRDSETLPERSLMKNMTNPEAAADHDRRKSVAVLAVEGSGGSARVNDNQDNSSAGVLLNMRSRSSSDPTNDRVDKEPRAEGTSSVPSNPQSRTTSAPTDEGVVEESPRQLNTRNQAQPSQLSNGLANSAESQRQLEESSALFDKLLRKFRRARRRQTAGAEEDETDSDQIESSRNRRKENIQFWMAFFIMSIIAFMIYFFTVTTPFKHLIFHGDI
jgi:hypothetical protein